MESLQLTLDKRLSLKKEEHEQKGWLGNGLYQKQNTSRGTGKLRADGKVLDAKLMELKVQALELRTRLVLEMEFFLSEQNLKA